MGYTWMARYDRWSKERRVMSVQVLNHINSVLFHGDLSKNVCQCHLKIAVLQVN